MQKIKFSISIQATPAKVWAALWQDANYREWTSAFCEGSYAISDWKEGSKIQFLSPDGGGMYSTIDKLIVDKQMSFKHIGVMKNNEEQPLDDETKAWTGSMEEYFLTEENGQTVLTTQMDTADSFADYFADTFPKALEKVKAIAEQ